MTHTQYLLIAYLIGILTVVVPALFFYRMGGDSDMGIWVSVPKKRKK